MLAASSFSNPGTNAFRSILRTSQLRPCYRALHSSSKAPVSSSLVAVSIQFGQSKYRLAIALPASVPSFFSRAFGPSPFASSFPPLALELNGPSVSSQQAQHLESSDQETIGSWWNGLLRAVPKKKVSHSRKGMRSANKGLKDRTDLVHCASCGRPKLHHHICGHCFHEVARHQKIQQRLKQQNSEHK